MPRISDLNDILFAVETHPVFVSVREGQVERRIRVPEKKAVLNRTGGRVLGIVSRGYRLVSNQEALDLAKKCCRAAFPETQESEWHVGVVDAPATGGHCFIDLLHNSAALDFSVVPAAKRPDTFGPFIRVTNSYNGLRALTFDIGFHRKVCKNGMILPDSIIRFKFTHLDRDIGETVQFDVAHDRMARLKARFHDQFRVLHTCPVRRDQFEPLFFHVIPIPRPQHLDPDSSKGKQWKDLDTRLGELCDRYAHDLGENAYAVFNAITDFASHPPANRIVGRERHSLQRLAGTWLTEFSQECRKPGFRLDHYLSKMEEGAQQLHS